MADRLGFWELSVQVVIPQLLVAVRWTLALTICAAVLGTALGLVIALMRISRSRLLRALATGYVTLLRGTPLMLQLLFIYYGLPQIDPRLTFDPFPAAVIGMGLNSGAYIAEIIRAAIQSIDKGQMEAARSLGLSYGQAMRFVILPQTYRRLIPPMVNELVALSKDTAQAMVIGLEELLRTGSHLASRFARPGPAYLWTAVFYLGITVVLSAVATHLEQKLEAKE